MITLEDFTRNLADLLRQEGYHVRSYSGRGMYDAECFGVGLASASGALQLGITIGRALADLDPVGLYRGRLGPSLDSLGTGAILYFRSLPWVASIGDEETDEETDDDR